VQAKEYACCALKHACKESELVLDAKGIYQPGTCKLINGDTMSCKHVDALDHWCLYTDEAEYKRVQTGGIVTTLLMASIMV
jgi:hypothetical protein